MTTVICRTLDSPIGTITVAGDGTTVTHLRMVEQTHAPADQRRVATRPGGLPRGGAPAPGLLRRGPHRVRPPPPAPRHLLPAAGVECPRRDPLRRDGLVRRDRPPGGQARARPGPSAWPTGRTPSPSSSPATGSSGPTAPSPATAVDSTASRSCSSWSGITSPHAWPSPS